MTTCKQTHSVRSLQQSCKNCGQTYEEHHYIELDVGMGDKESFLTCKGKVGEEWEESTNPEPKVSQ